VNILGYLCLILITISCFAGLGLALAGLSTGRRELTRSAVTAVYVVTGLAVVASIALVVVLVTRDFSNQYVYDYTSKSLSLAYTMSGFWAGNAGSLLLWLLLLAIFSLVALRQIRREDPDSTPYVAPILLAIITFFSLLTVFGNNSNPFLLLDGVNPFAGLPAGAVPDDGYGMNPMLQHPGMVIHPVALYLGFVGCAIPFAVAMGGLLARSPSVGWLPAVRRWTLVGWLFLSIGNLVGAWWAYVTLGWGGYWAWDPVENDSLMPWLTATALVHAVIMTRRRRMFLGWTAVLVAITFLLTIFGTFLTRSGIASSLHAFSDNTFVPWFTVFLIIGIVFSIAVIVSRRSELASGKRLVDMLSRESAFLYTYLVLVIIAFVVLWGVVFPTITGALRGTKVELNPNFFTVVTVPLTVILMFLIGLCPLLPWRGRDRKQLLKDATWTATPAVIVLVCYSPSASKALHLLSFTLATFALASVVVQYARGWRARHKASGAGWVRSFGGMVWANRSRYGGFLVHLGVIIVLVGITGSYAFKQDVKTDLAKGDSLTIGRYELTYDDLASEQAADKELARATFTITRDGKVVGRVHPVKEYYYPPQDQTWTRVALRSTLTDDVYVTLLGFAEDGSSVSVEAQLNPLVIWLWIGGGVLVMGGLIAMWPARRATARDVQYTREVSKSPSSAAARRRPGADR
jgi:cytochrome c-type biogenesis protein CcmF